MSLSEPNDFQVITLKKHYITCYILLANFFKLKKKKPKKKPKFQKEMKL